MLILLGTHHNIGISIDWVATTERGEKYFNEILSPKFYNKYKDLEVEIDDKGNIIRWIGKINK